MKILLHVLFTALIVGALTGFAEAKVKPKSFASVNQSQSSIAIDPAGFPHIAYQGADGHLYHARFDGRKWQQELVDSSQYYGNAMAIDSQGHIHIVYGAERTDGSTWTYPLVYAYFNGTSWQVTDLPVSGFNPRIALDAAGHPHVLYRGGSSYGYGAYDGANWEFNDTGLSWSWYSDGLVLDADGDAHISYSINYAGGFYATNKSGSWEATKLESDNSGSTAIALDNAGNPRVVIGTGGSLTYFSYDGSSWTNEPMVNFNDADPQIQAVVESQIAMVTDANGRAQILAPVYLSSGNRYVEVLVLVFDDGTGWNGLLVDQKNTGFYPSIALDTNGVAYGTYCSAIKNNRAKGSWVRMALSDLTATWTNVNVVGSTVTGTLNVTNHGMDKSVKTTVSLWLSDDETVDASDTPVLAFLRVKALTPGSSVAVPVNFNYAGTLAGKHLIAVVDPAMNTSDRNLLDNIAPVLLEP